MVGCCFASLLQGCEAGPVEVHERGRDVRRIVDLLVEDGAELEERCGQVLCGKRSMPYHGFLVGADRGGDWAHRLRLVE